MSEWEYAQQDNDEHFARLHFFSTLKTASDGSQIEVGIKVREHVTPRDPAMKFFARTDRAFNQKSMPYEPAGWGTTLLEALTMCMREIKRFPLEP